MKEIDPSITGGAEVFFFQLIIFLLTLFIMVGQNLFVLIYSYFHNCS